MTLDQLEARLRALVDDQLVGAPRGGKPEHVLVEALIAAMQAGAGAASSGRRAAPNVYAFQVPAKALGRWKVPELQAAMLEVVKVAGEEADLRVDSTPILTFGSDTAARPGEFRIVASRGMLASAEPPAASSTAADETTAPEEPGNVPESAFLIVDGVKEFRLRRQVINIGRRLDNDLVVDDPRVSRHHVQLRSIKGRFVLFDLNSSGGTFINGQRASQSILYPGDVISLAGVSLIFGQDNPLPQRELSRTAPRSQAGAERATAIMRPNDSPSKKRR